MCVCVHVEWGGRGGGGEGGSGGEDTLATISSPGILPLSPSPHIHPRGQDTQVGDKLFLSDAAQLMCVFIFQNVLMH